MKSTLNQPLSHRCSQRYVWSGITWWLTTCHNKTPLSKLTGLGINSSLEDRRDAPRFFFFFFLSDVILHQDREAQWNKTETGRKTWSGHLRPSAPTAARVRKKAKRGGGMAMTKRPNAKGWKKRWGRSWRWRWGGRKRSLWQDTQTCACQNKTPIHNKEVHKLNKKEGSPKVTLEPSYYMSCVAVYAIVVSLLRWFWTMRCIYKSD